MVELSKNCSLSSGAHPVLNITWQPEGCSFPDILGIEVLQPLRVLEGRREVWLAREQVGNKLIVAKRFLAGKKQQREFRREVNGLKNLASRGVRGPELQFTAKDDEQSLWAATVFIENGESLSSIFHHQENSVFKDLSPIVKAFAEVMVQHWASGVHQTDAHFKNYYWDGAEIYTLDVGLIQFNEAPLKRGLREETLYKMAMRFPKNLREEFYEALQVALQNAQGLEDYKLPASDVIEHRIDEMVLSEAHRLWEKSFRSSSKIIWQHSGSMSFCAMRDLDVSLSSALHDNPEALMAEGVRLKSGNTCTVQKIERNGRAYILKRYNPKPLLYRIRHKFLLSRARRSWANGHVLGTFNIQTPSPMALLEQRKYGFVVRSYFLMECVEGSGLDDFFEDTSELPAATNFIFQEIGELFERMYCYRISHGDLKAKNLIVKDQQIWLIDLDGLRFDLSRSSFARCIQSDIRRFLKNWDHRSDLREMLAKLLKRISN